MSQVQALLLKILVVYVGDMLAKCRENVQMLQSLKKLFRFATFLSKTDWSDGQNVAWRAHLVIRACLCHRHQAHSA